MRQYPLDHGSLADEAYDLHLATATVVDTTGVLFAVTPG
jgi:hypothetical protein